MVSPFEFQQGRRIDEHTVEVIFDFWVDEAGRRDVATFKVLVPDSTTDLGQGFVQGDALPSNIKRDAYRRAKSKVVNRFIDATEPS